MACVHCEPPASPAYCAPCRRECTREAPCPCCLSGAGYPSLHRRLPEQVLAAYESRVPGARRARETDPGTARVYRLIEVMLAVMDAALTDEGVDGRTRHRVLAAVAYAAATPAPRTEQDRREREEQQITPVREPFRRPGQAQPATPALPQGLLLPPYPIPAGEARGVGDG